MNAPPEVWLDDTGILHIDYGRREQVTAADIQAAYRLHMALSPRKHPVLTVGSGFGRVDAAAQRYASSPEIVAVCAANALVVQSAWQMHLGRLFLHLYRPPYPVRLFTDRAMAIDWLKQYLPPPDAGARDMAT
jgi:hypothetical protein